MPRTRSLTLAARLSLSMTVVVALSNCSASDEPPTQNPVGSGGSGGRPEMGGSAGSVPDFDGAAGGGGVAGAGGSQVSDDAGPDSPAPTTDGSPTADARDGTTIVTPDASEGGVLDPSVVAVMRRVADWELMQGDLNGFDWIHGAMWTGLFATFQTTGDVKYRNAITAWGQSHNWGLAGGGADNQCAAQTYYDMYMLDRTNMAMLNGSKPAMDGMVNGGNAGWTWCDSLFMSPPGVTRLGAITNDTKYFQFLHTNWWRAYGAMFSTANGLIYRDPPAGGPNNGNGVFWARGNGWVIAGTARVLQYLPQSDARRPEYVTMFTTMAAALKKWQQPDGLWRADITHPNAIPNPETSGTGFITFGMAWGINNGILDRATYLPVVKVGWQGLVSHVDANGRLGYVQGVGAAPAPASATSNAPYGVGAFLLAASEVAKL